MGTVYFCLESPFILFVVCFPVTENGYTRDAKRYGGIENAAQFSGGISTFSAVAFQQIFPQRDLIEPWD